MCWIRGQGAVYLSPCCPDSPSPIAENPYRLTRERIPAYRPKNYSLFTVYRLPFTSMHTLLIGSNNAHKVEELQAIFAGLPVRLITLRDAGIEHDVDETGTTFEENARLKAEAYCQMSGLPTLADDSGLEVAALNNAPGIYTARWALPDMTNPHRSYARVLEELKGRPFHDRIARFVCVIALARPQHETVFVQGTLPGVIAEQPRGTHGFGYDPVFYLLDYDKHLAELPPEIKNRISHRANAAALAREVIEGWLNEDSESKQ